MKPAKHPHHPPIIFIHLPKCGGISLRNLVASQYKEDRRTFIYNNELDVEIPGLEFVRKLQENRDKMQMVYGHFSFGAHHKLNMPPIYATVLRDPLKRIISFYKFLNHNKEVGRYYSENIGTFSLKAFVENRITIQTNNHLTRIIAGQPPSLIKRLDDPVYLEIAKVNIEKYFLFTGVLDTLEEDIKALAAFLGWHCHSLSRANASPQSQSVEVDSETRQLIIEHNQLDIALYQWVKARVRKLNPEVFEKAKYWQTGVIRWRSKNSVYHFAKTPKKQTEKFTVSVQLPRANGNAFVQILHDIFKEKLAFDTGDRPLWYDEETRQRHAREMSITKLTENFPDDCRCVHGGFLPVKYVALQKYHRLAFVTWFRDPVTRMVSHYHAWRKKFKPGQVAAIRERMHVENWSLEGFCRQVEMQNIYSQFLWRMPPEQFDFIGIAEHFERDIQLFAKMFSLELEIPCLKEFLDLEREAEQFPISKALRNYIQSTNQADMILYEKAKRRNRELREQYGIVKQH